MSYALFVIKETTLLFGGHYFTYRKARDERLKTMWTTVNKLPKTNYNNVKYLIKFLSKLAEKSDINKMTPSNIAIVFGPNLLYSKDSDNE